jgi:hypothetical protein
LRTPPLKNATKISFISVCFFDFAYPCGLLTYPLWPLHIPLGVPLNRWSRTLHTEHSLFVVMTLDIFPITCVILKADFHKIVHRMFLKCVLPTFNWNSLLRGSATISISVWNRYLVQSD